MSLNIVRGKLALHACPASHLFRPVLMSPSNAMTRYPDGTPQPLPTTRPKGPVARCVKIFNWRYEGYFTSAPSETREGVHRRHLRRRSRIPSGHPTDPFEVRSWAHPFEGRCIDPGRGPSRKMEASRLRGLHLDTGLEDISHNLSRAYEKTFHLIHAIHSIRDSGQMS